MNSSSKRPLRSQSSHGEEREEAEEASLSHLSREAGIASSPRQMTGREASLSAQQPRGGLTKSSSSSSSSMSPTAGFVRRYCFFGILLSLVVLIVHLAETSSILERSMLVLTGTSSSSSSSLPRVIHEVAPARHAQVERKGKSKQLRASTRESTDPAVDKQECSVWMAPSSLPGDSSGFGIFVTRSVKAGDSLLGGPDGIGIPISTYHRDDSEPNGVEARRFRHFFYDYTWARGMPDHVLYDSPPSVVDFQTGMGSLPNHHCVLSHLRTAYPNPPYDDSLVSRFKDASAGSFSYNRGREFFVDHDVEAGDEIFLSYGLCEPEIRKAGTWTDELFVTSDYASAASVVLRTRYNVSAAELSFEDATGAARIAPSIDRHVAALLPQSREEFRDMLNAADRRGGGLDEVVRQVALHKLNRRTPEWIRQNGRCLDNLVVRPSTVPGAGHGAFTQRTIRQGEIVVPAPLLQILDKDALKIYSRSGKHVETQLLLNYCFGHPKSSLLLCPNTNAALINHCSHRTKDCGPRGPNAEYRWAMSWDRSTPVWLNLTLEEMDGRTGHGLSLEIVATREIKPGEEVFIDYGVEWERAWMRHVKTWAPPTLPSMSQPWLTAREANDAKGPILTEFVAGDLRSRVKHPYLFTGCQYWATSRDDDARFSKLPPEGGWRSMSDEEIIAAYSEPAGFYTDNDSGRRSYDRHRDRSHWPCTVLRPESDGKYTVRVHVPFFAETTQWEENRLPRILTNYSREFIHYFVLPYASDQHLPGVFRHEIGIRDDMFPEHWKNLASTTVMQ